MIKYNPRAAKAIGLLKAVQNDIEVYVEDSSKSAVWLAYVRSCLPPELRLASVNPIGRREDVILACKQDQAADGRRRIYLIDADFDLILNRRKVRLQYLHRLPLYCLENVAGNLPALSQVVAELAPQLPADVVETDLAAFLEQHWGKPLRRLFGLYATHAFVGGSCVTSKYHVSRLAQPGSNPWQVAKAEFAAKTKEILAEIRRKRRGAVPVATVMRRAARLPLSQVASGKGYCLPLIMRWLASSAGVNLSSDQIMLLVIARAGCTDPRLRRAIATQGLP